MGPTQESDHSPSQLQSHGSAPSPVGREPTTASATVGVADFISTTDQEAMPASPVSRQRRRGSTIAQSLMNSSPPYGMWQAAGEVASKAPTLAEIKHGAFSAEGWTEEGQLERRGYTQHQIQKRRESRASSQSSSRLGRHRTSSLSMKRVESDGSRSLARPQLSNEAYGPPSTIAEASAEVGTNVTPRIASDGKPTSPDTTDLPLRSSSTHDRSQDLPMPTSGPDETGTYPNGYRFPPKNSWSKSMAIGVKAFWKFFLTPFGFLVTIYGLNIVAWGAMLFFVLLEAAPAMCHPSCGDPNSARQIWIEIDSQILNALFCVTGFGLIPWRFRDFYYLMKWRVFRKHDYFRRLAGHNRSWFRLPGSDKLDVLLSPPPLYSEKNPRLDHSPPEWTEEDMARLAENPAIPLPPTSLPPAPLTGLRAQPTKPFLIDLVVWMYLLNTVIQACLAGVMWGLNRFTRPPWVTGFLISMGCLVAIVAGLVIFVQGKKVKKMEGILVVEEEVEVDVESVEEKRGLEKQRKVGEHSERGKGQEEVFPQQKVVQNVDGDEPQQKLKRTDTKTIKTKGGHWFERR